MKKENQNNILVKKIFLTGKKSIIGFFLITLFFLGAKISQADYLTSEQCAAQGGTCNWISNNCSDDETPVGLCQGGTFSQGACCKKTLKDTSGADPNPTGAGIGAGGTLQDPNAGLGGAQGGTVTPGTSGIPIAPANPSASTADTSKSLVPCTDNCTLCDIVLGIKRIFDYFMTLLVIVATLFIIIAGIAYMVSGGSKSLMEWAKKALMYALIGFVLYLASWIIVSSILSAMGYNRTGWSTFDCESGS
jgi:hypothetical protein